MPIDTHKNLSREIDGESSTEIEAQHLCRRARAARLSARSRRAREMPEIDDCVAPPRHLFVQLELERVGSQSDGAFSFTEPGAAGQLSCGPPK
jgi:hypothetical protein